MIRVLTGSRIHLGMLMPTKLDWPPRQFGGVGMMVESPSLAITFEQAEEWCASGPLAERALRFAQQFTQSLVAEQVTIPPQRMIIESAPPEHVGLGVGTQLGLAVARGLATVVGKEDLTTWELAQRVGRGRRSALGIHGFERGGFLVEAGQGPHEGLPPLIAAPAFPDEWGVLLLIPKDAQGQHGAQEEQAFAELQLDIGATVDRLCRLTLLGILPALAEKDLKIFGEAIFELNQKVGEMFRPVQGGIYSHPMTETLIRWLRTEGITGVGQSSWGPTVFAILHQEDMAPLAATTRKRCPSTDLDVIHTSVRNGGAVSAKRNPCS